MAQIVTFVGFDTAVDGLLNHRFCVGFDTAVDGLLNHRFCVGFDTAVGGLLNHQVLGDVVG